ncbi:MAG: MBL fold metallo-hydrolase [Candidatus Bathyarchaeota archaeon]|nr:MAG: MBL fold metallo-hydrolase [Candidatus Bathyarchaeota archaeon]
MIIKWLGHASFLLKVLDKAFYIDPYAGDYVEQADVILITHRHGDHCDVEKIAAVQRSDTVIVTSSDCASILDGNVITLSPGDRRNIHGVEVEAVEAYNYKRFRSPGVPFHPKGTQIGFILSAQGKQIYHAGDTDFIPEMTELNDIDVALLPIMGRATMDLEEAVEAAVAIHPKIAIPMHRRDASAEEFKEKVETQSNVKVLAIKEGDEIDP